MNDMQALQGEESAIREAATAIFDDVLAAHGSGDYARLAPYLSAELGDAMDEETFGEIVEAHLAPLGAPTAVAWIGALRKPDATQALWKVSYGESGIELLWQLFIASDGERSELVGLLFS